jgi:microsomal epoxide hydrolase
MTALQPFRLAVPEATLSDLRDRLRRVRWPDQPPHGEPWQFGTDLVYLRELVAYWLDGFDWRRQEALLNEFPQFTTPVAGIDLHFVRVEGVGPAPMPLLLSHGWPGSVWEFYKIIPLLTDPGGFGGDPADAFTVIAPSLPGFTLSFRPGQSRLSLPAIANVFRTLMHDTLGFQRFGAQGGDFGAFISADLGWIAPDQMIGIHLNMLPLSRQPLPPPEDDDEDLAKYRSELEHWMREETGYSSIQGTRPQTLAYGLTDSPVGLAAWIVEKFRTWSDCRGDIERSFSRDDLLTNITLYWVTGAIGSTFWPYYARTHEGWPTPRDRRVTVPTGYLSFPKDILHPPRSFAERSFAIKRWNESPVGGHFAALEQPERLAEDVRAFFRDYR